MRARSVALAAITTVALLATQVVAAYAAAPASERYIVLLRPDADARGIVTALEHAHGFTSDFRYEALKGFAARLTPSQLALVRTHPAVAVVSADQTVEAVGSVPLAAGETAPTGVRRIDAASTTSASAASTVSVAVIDTGVSLAHPDLNAVSGKNCVTAGASANDDNGHGSHVAGTIAARNTGSGVVGVAPNTTVYAVKVLNSAGSGTWAQVICGIDWVTANGPSLGIKVANMSLGGSGSSDTNCGYSNGDALHQAICRSTAAGITYAVAAGNSGVSLAGQVPAAYPEVLAVTAMADSDGVSGGAGPRPTCRTSESDDSYATFSNYAVSSGAQSHTVAGPGVCIYSTWLNGGYNTISGTSMATPHLTGTIALCFGSGGVAGPCAGLTPASVIQRIRTDAQAHATATNGFAGDPSRPLRGRCHRRHRPATIRSSTVASRRAR